MDAHKEFSTAVACETEKSTAGLMLTTVGKVNNATENPINYITHHDWDGYFKSIPKTIANGSTSIFTHAPRFFRDSAALVYRCKNSCGCDMDWMLAWINKPRKKAYTEIQEAGYTWDWNKVKNKLDNGTAESTYKAEGLSATVSIYKNDYKAVITTTD